MSIVIGFHIITLIARNACNYGRGSYSAVLVYTSARHVRVNGLRGELEIDNQRRGCGRRIAS